MFNPVRTCREVVAPIAKGMALTMRTYVKMIVSRSKASPTIEYPEVRREQFPRTRWRHVLTRYDNGLEKCIGCSLCAGACPSRCIYVEADENTDAQRFSPGERYAKRYEINMLRCVFCGYCQEACPTGAITLRKDFELADYSREALLYTKEMLLEPLPPKIATPVSRGAPRDTTPARETG